MSDVVTDVANRQQPPVPEDEVDLPRDQLVVDEVAVVDGDVECAR